MTSPSILPGNEVASNVVKMHLDDQYSVQSIQIPADKRSSLETNNSRDCIYCSNEGGADEDRVSKYFPFYFPFRVPTN